MLKRTVTVALVVASFAFSVPAGAQTDTLLAGRLHGVVRFRGTIPQPFTFTGGLRVGGSYAGVPSAGAYSCTAYGVGYGQVGPVSGTFGCWANDVVGNAPVTATGSFTGETLLAKVLLNGFFNGHPFACDGAAAPRLIQADYALEMACEIGEPRPA